MYKFFWRHIHKFFRQIYKLGNLLLKHLFDTRENFP